ncbi:Tn3 family transposase [Nocardia sp. NPDC052254]|uniref:Tn3 family transposase n=1 Tax=Nocardia sp. NPDC052254 TaxID=3155681 RepID=UPI003431CCB3
MILGFDLLPRIKRINKCKLYRPAAGESGLWPGLGPAMTRPIRWELIAGSVHHRCGGGARGPHHPQRRRRLSRQRRPGSGSSSSLPCIT